MYDDMHKEADWFPSFTGNLVDYETYQKADKEYNVTVSFKWSCTFLFPMCFVVVCYDFVLVIVSASTLIDYATMQMRIQLQYVVMTSFYMIMSLNTPLGTTRQESDAALRKGNGG